MRAKTANPDLSHLIPAFKGLGISREADLIVERSWVDINAEVCNACITGDLHTAKEMLTKQIDADVNNYHSYANHSTVNRLHPLWWRPSCPVKRRNLNCEEITDRLGSQ
jgi:hypothetical protein